MLKLWFVSAAPTIPRIYSKHWDVVEVLHGSEAETQAELQPESLRPNPSGTAKFETQTQTESSRSVLFYQLLNIRLQD